jgi:CRP-like cAMP-binding protein
MSSISENPELSSEEVAAQLLVTTSALKELTMEDAIRVVSYMRPRWIPAGTVFIHEGEVEQNDFMLLVLDGDIAVETEIPNMNEGMVLNIIGPGHLIGEMGLLDGAPRSATCTASTDVMAAVLTRNALMDLLKDEPELAARLLMAISKRMADRLRTMTRKLNAFAQMNKALQDELQAVIRSSKARAKRAA